MKNKEDLWNKIKKIGGLMGEKTVFKIGVDTKNGKIDLLSVDVCSEEDNKEIIAELPDPDYIG